MEAGFDAGCEFRAGPFANGVFIIGRGTTELVASGTQPCTLVVMSIGGIGGGTLNGFAAFVAEDDCG